MPVVQFGPPRKAFLIVSKSMEEIFAYSLKEKVYEYPRVYSPATPSLRVTDKLHPYPRVLEYTKHRHRYPTIYPLLSMRTMMENKFVSIKSFDNKNKFLRT